MMLLTPHDSVLLAEIVQWFEPLSLKVVIDATLGGGGHAKELLERHPEIEYYIGIDQDPNALAIASKRLASWRSKLFLRQGNFVQFDQFLKELSLPCANAILADLGVSSMQLDEPCRGFSFMREGPLDMRMNPLSKLTVADVVNFSSEQELGRIFRDYGEEKGWKAAAHAIVQARCIKPFVTTKDLTYALNPVLSPFFTKKRIHPLTLVFQALRICVNRELEVLEAFLPKAIHDLSPGGRLAVISFHRLEDRIVKAQMRFAASDKWETSGLSGLFRDKEPIIKLLTRKPIEPSKEEKFKNFRSRSAKLRVIEKILTI